MKIVICFHSPSRLPHELFPMQNGLRLLWNCSEVLNFLRYTCIIYCVCVHMSVRWFHSITKALQDNRTNVSGFSVTSGDDLLSLGVWGRTQHELGFEIVLVLVQMHTGAFSWIRGAALTTAEPQQSRPHIQIGLPYSLRDLQGSAESQHTANTWQCQLNPSMSKIPLRVLRNGTSETWLPRLINGQANRGAGCC